MLSCYTDLNLNVSFAIHSDMFGSSFCLCVQQKWCYCLFSWLEYKYATCPVDRTYSISRNTTIAITTFIIFLSTFQFLFVVNVSCDLMASWWIMVRLEDHTHCTDEGIETKEVKWLVQICIDLTFVEVSRTVLPILLSVLLIYVCPTPKV
jgi:hypothetical protein